jgi:hypothetical protein
MVLLRRSNRCQVAVAISAAMLTVLGGLARDGTRLTSRGAVGVRVAVGLGPLAWAR